MTKLIIGILLMGCGLALMTIGGYLAKGGWDRLFNPKEAAERNLIHLLQPTLNSLSYSYRILKEIPYSIENLPEELSPYRSPYNVRRFRLKNKDYYYLFAPEPSQSNRSINKVVFLIIKEVDIDKAKLYEVLGDSDKVDLFFQLVTKCEQANECLHRFWESTKEGDAEKAPNWDIHKYDRHDRELAFIRQAKAKHFVDVIDDVSALIKKANEKWGYDLSFTIN